MMLDRFREIKKLNRTIRTLEERRANVMARATSTTSGGWKRVCYKNADGSEEYASALRGMPHSPSKSDKVADGGIELATIDHSLRTAKRKRDSLLRCIKRIEDDYIRETLLLKFVSGYTWEKIARLQGISSGESVRKYCERFFGTGKSR